MGICHRQFTRLTGEKSSRLTWRKVRWSEKGTSGYVLVGWENPQLREDIFSKRGLPGTTKGTFGYEYGDFRV